MFPFQYLPIPKEIECSGEDSMQGPFDLSTFKELYACCCLQWGPIVSLWRVTLGLALAWICLESSQDPSANKRMHPSPASRRIVWLQELGNKDQYPPIMRHSHQGDPHRYRKIPVTLHPNSSHLLMYTIEVHNKIVNGCSFFTSILYSLTSVTPPLSYSYPPSDHPKENLFCPPRKIPASPQTSSLTNLSAQIDSFSVINYLIVDIHL